MNVTYHIQGDFPDFRVAMLLPEFLHFLLFFGDFSCQNSFQVRRGIAHLPKNHRYLGNDLFLKREKKGELL